MNNIAALCALVVTAIAAYSFEDLEYNRLFAGDIDDDSDNYHSVAHPRVRRDEEAAKEDEKRFHMRLKRLCCAAETMKKINEEYREVARECSKEVEEKEKHQMFDPFNGESMKQYMKIFICSTECIARKLHMLDSEGNMKPEEFESFIKESYAMETWVEPMQDKIISTCLNEAKNATANRDLYDSSSCNPASASTSHCLIREIQMNCPADQIKDERSCARLRDRLKASDMYDPLSPPPGGSMEEPDN